MFFIELGSRERKLRERQIALDREKKAREKQIQLDREREVRKREHNKSR